MTFDFTTIGTGLIINFSNDLRPEACKELVSQVEFELTNNDKITKLAFLMHTKFDLDPSVFRILTPFAMGLRKRDIEIYIIDAMKELRKSIRTMGMDSLLKVGKSLEELQLEMKPKVPIDHKIDVEFVNPFIDGTIETLKVQCQIECKALDLIAKLKDDPAPVNAAIAGVIGLTSQKFNGSIAICFSEQFFLTVMSNMLGEKFTEITKDLEDGAGELLNIIFGFGKRVLNAQGHTLEKAIPSVVRGDNITIRHLTSRPTIVVPFQSNYGNFYIEVGTEENI